MQNTSQKISLPLSKSLSSQLEKKKKKKSAW